MVLTSIGDEKHLPRWFARFFSVLQRLETGALEVALPDGRVFAVHGEQSGPVGHIDVDNPDFFTRMARDGEIGFPEMFMEGWWRSPDLQALLDVLLLNNDNVASGFPGAALVRAYERLRHWLRSNTRRGARRNIAYHYDLGNEFYRLWLDETMTYSSALFSGQGETLRDAQQNKYASICDRMGMAREDHVLEIGCGWGGFAEYAIREHGARITGLTLSREQRDYARKRLFDAGLAERAEIVMRDYRDEADIYDGIASIEMFEAVGEKFWPAYFRAVRGRLRPGRVASLQIITIDDRLFDRYRCGTGAAPTSFRSTSSRAECCRRRRRCAGNSPSPGSRFSARSSFPAAIRARCASGARRSIPAGARSRIWASISGFTACGTIICVPVRPVSAPVQPMLCKLPCVEPPN